MRRVIGMEIPGGGIYSGEVDEKGCPNSTKGTCAWSGGISYTGHWVNGKMHGVGTMYYADGKQVYGVWYEGELIYEFKHQKQEPTEVPEQRPNNPPVKNKKIVALLIGNNNYQHFTTLNNCQNDIDALELKLRSLGIDCMVCKDATKKGFQDVLREILFGKAEGHLDYEHILFYFSGHGATCHGRHYIVAIDDDISDINLSIEWLDGMFSKAGYENIILISDACSNVVNGIDDDLQITIGLKTVKAFSSTIEQTAWDGIPGSHSPYAFGLLEYIDKQMTIGEILEEARKLTLAVAYKHNPDSYQVPRLDFAPLFPTDFCLY